MCFVKEYRFYLLFVLFVLLKTGSLAAQDSVLHARYSFSFKNKILPDVLLEIKQKSNLGLSYNPDYISLDKLYSGDFKEVPLYEILDSVLQRFNLKYKLIGSTLALSKVESGIQVTDTKSRFLPSDTLSLLKVCGKIEDEITHNGISYASVFIKRRALGTISNTDGNFFINIPPQFLADTLFVSFIGYKTVQIPVCELKTGVFNLISMQAKTIALPEVIVRYIDVNGLLLNVIKNIPLNYSLIPQRLDAFYRETLQQNGKYVLFSEAVLDIYKSGYAGFQNDQVSIFKGRKNQIREKMDTIKLKLQGGIYNCLQLDLAKYQSNFMSGENRDFYEYKYEGIADIQEHLAYVVSFDQKENVPYSMFKGKIYIDTEHFALIRAEFNLSPRGLSYAAQSLVQKAPRGVKVKPSGAYYLVNYTERGNKWYLGNIREEVDFRIHKRLRLFSTDFKTVAEMVITNSDTLNVERLKHNGIIRSNDIFIEKLDKYDPDFWKNFNYIAPDKTLQDAIDEIVDKLHKKK